MLAQVAGAIEPYLLKQFFDSFEAHGNSADLYWWGGAIAGSFLLCHLLWRVSGFVGIHLVVGVENNVYRQLFSYLMEHSVGYFQNRFAGNLSSKVSTTASAVDSVLCDFIWHYCPLVIKIGISLYLTSLVHIWFTIGLFIWTMIFFVINWFLLQKKQRLSRAYYAISSTVSGDLVDTISNIGSVWQFARIRFEKNRFDQSLSRLKTADLASWQYGELILLLNGCLQAVLMAGMIYGSLRGWELGLLGLGDTVMLLTLTMMLTHELLFIGRQLKELMNNISQLREGLEVIGEPHDLIDTKNPQNCVIKHGAITLQNISFAYEEGAKDIFSDLSLVIHPGEKIGLVGRSGGGKTTITKLILRLMDVRNGKILVDDQDISQIKQSDLRKNIAYVPQEPILFHRTLAENIAYGDLTAERNKIISAAKKAHAHEFITEMRDGYDTLVGERGVKLSGGQKQRIAIARAILKPSPILILDEATSALDSESEKLIQSALDNAMANRTTLVIAHRLSTVQKMDRIIVLEKGTIVEQGSHEDLLKKNGAYAELWNHQYEDFLGES